MKRISRMRLRKTLLAVAASGLVVGCSSGPTEPSPPLEQLPRALSNAEMGVIEGSNGFAFDLLRLDAPIRRDPVDPPARGPHAELLARTAAYADLVNAYEQEMHTEAEEEVTT